MRLSVMGIDPGKTVGVALWHGKTPWHETVIKQNQFSREDALIMIKEWCQACAVDGTPAIIGCETFTARRGHHSAMTTQNDALEIIGAIKVFADMTDVKLSMQSPALAKRAMSSQTLKKFGWWVPETDGRHANDAARHVGGALLAHHPAILMSLHEHTK